MKTCIIYNSHSGTTKAYAEEISSFLSEKGIDNKIASISDYDKEYLQSAETILLGCWTSGLFFFAQHPDKAWKKFAAELPDIHNKSIGLFTTYKLATGSMFKKMEAKLRTKIDGVNVLFKSKSKNLTDENKIQIEEFLSK